MPAAMRRRGRRVSGESGALIEVERREEAPHNGVPLEDALRLTDSAGEELLARPDTPHRVSIDGGRERSDLVEVAPALPDGEKEDGRHDQSRYEEVVVTFG